jgi:hypothetical protein
MRLPSFRSRNGGETCHHGETTYSMGWLKWGPN